jgi:hypothetical protein
MDVLIFIHATSFIYSGLAACECKKLKKKKDGCCQIINYYVTAHSPAHHSGPWRCWASLISLHPHACEASQASLACSCKICLALVSFIAEHGYHWLGVARDELAVSGRAIQWRIGCGLCRRRL